MDLFTPTHLFLLLMVILIIFGPSKLGDVGGALGKGWARAGHSICHSPFAISRAPR